MEEGNIIKQQKANKQVDLFYSIARHKGKNQIKQNMQKRDVERHL